MQNAYAGGGDWDIPQQTAQIMVTDDSDPWENVLVQTEELVGAKTLLGIFLIGVAVVGTAAYRKWVR